MTTPHSISNHAAAAILRSLDEAALEQLIDLGLAHDGQRAPVPYNRVNPQLRRYVVNERGVAHLNFLGMALVVTGAEMIEQALG